MWNPDGANYSRINLSTASSSSSSAILNNIRAERQARERQRALENAATTVQRIWRGREAASRAREELLSRLEGNGHSLSIPEGASALLFLLKGGTERVRVAEVLQAWCAAAVLPGQDGIPVFAVPLASNVEYSVVLALLLPRILRFVSVNPRTTLAASLLTSLEALLAPQAYTQMSSASLEDFTAILGHQGWIEIGVGILDTLVAASPPKKKHPLLPPVIRLLLAPLALSPLTAASPLLPPMLQRLLSVPSLPSVIPLQSLTYLSSNLPLFSILLPTAAAHPEILSQGALTDESARMYWLANIATFGITGGMLARNGTQGTNVWIRVIGTMVASLGPGWGRWAEGGSAPTPPEAAILAVDSEDSDAEGPKTAVPKARPQLPPSVASKLMQLASTAHLSTLAGSVINSADISLLGSYSSFVIGILHAFRGTSRWEATLDAVMDGKRGRALVKLLWREGVRGKWESTADAWGGFATNANKSALLLLSHLYCHYLLLTPDDEFFAPALNPLTLDEVLELSLIWRDLAFWGYLNGVNGGAVIPGTTNTVPSRAGTEEERSLFTRGVTRVSERNARRQFAPDEYWVMQTDMHGFIEAVKYEAEELEQGAMQGLAARGGPRNLSRRQIAYYAPRLGLLNNLSMTVPFQTRVEVFRHFVQADRQRLGISFYNRDTRHTVEIRRTHLAEDGFRQLNRLGPSMKGMVQITFIDQWGNEEAGIDGGGLFKEFLTALSKEAFDTERGLWLSNYNNELYPNPHKYATEPHQLQWYSFIGRVLGKALYEDILVDVSFAGFFLAKWLGRQSYLDDLASLDKDLYRGLISLKNYPGNPEDLSLNFTVTEDDFGVARSVDLVPGGSDIAVTSENKHEYIQLVCRYKLDRQFVEQSRAFFSGLSDIIDPKWLRMFDQHELAQLLGGEEVPIDVKDLRKHTTMTGFTDQTTPQMFWKVVEDLDQDQRRALLRFVTSCSRPPLLGFGHLNPGFAVRNSGNDTARLPTASSCANLLKLPDYQDVQLLKAKLLQAINSGAGFDMS